MAFEFRKVEDRTKTKEKESKWITVGGRRIEIEAGENVEEKLAEKPTNIRGEKERNSKEAKKSFIKRLNIKKPVFKTREEVVFDKYENEGVVYGLDGDYVNILSKGQHITKHISDVFRKSEITIFGHWDAMPLNKRVELLKNKNISQDYMNVEWYWLPESVKKTIIKAQSPNGMDGQGGYSTNTSGVFNPVNQEKTVEERIQEEKKKPEEHEEKRDS